MTHALMVALASLQGTVTARARAFSSAEALPRRPIQPAGAAQHETSATLRADESKPQ
jgi:hypothetical protein